MSDDSGTTDPSIDADLETLIQLMSRMVRGMKGADGHREAEEFMARVKDAGLGPRHVPALMALVLNGPAPVGVLARHMALNPATASQLLGELERGGFVERRPDDRDRRRMIVSLHEAHRAAIERFAWRRVRPLRTALEALDPVERRHFLNGWRVLVDSIERARRHRPAPGRPDDCPNT
ncbi:MarR family winged helix-turn-helix transcriptional regulator [Actinomadura chibensis]|uniref:MarR family transcriptional regulator n=1 Tax=Actinomadura chibensis TaxID=392828 RepID=A0A5D0NGV8_9ACTN|nr:MarR family winged helix-turn-helix transcriptional regulator [Actinomadura chibensis]TYB43582.1 MarR family transcriptional regulator [Actinomadura chibensis]